LFFPVIRKKIKSILEVSHFFFHIFNFESYPGEKNLHPLWLIQTGIIHQITTFWQI